MSAKRSKKDKKEKKAKKVKTLSFVLSMPLHYSKQQEDKLNKLFSSCQKLSNVFIQDRLKALHEMEKTRAYRSAKQDIAKLYEEESDKEKWTKKANKEYKRCKKELNALKEEYGFSKFTFRKRIGKFRHHYPTINSRVAQGLADRVWGKFEKYFFDTGKEIRFISWDNFLSIEGNDNKTGIIFKSDCRKVCLCGMEIPIANRPLTDYELEALDSTIHRVKYCRIVRIHHKHGWLYRLQLTLEGTPPAKGFCLGDGKVGIDIGTQTVAVASSENVLLTELADKANMVHNELRRINRAMDRSRRAMNPEMFAADGTIVPINKLPLECIKQNGKRLWRESKKYKALAIKRRYLYSRLARLRIVQHNTLANKMLPFGDTFYVETMRFSALAKKAKAKTEEEVKANGGKYKRRKRFGKSIANKAPASFLNILERKVKARHGNFYRIDTVKAKASQYNHITGKCVKKPLSKRWNNDIGGHRVQRDLYSAFLLMNTNRTLDGFVAKDCKATFKNFMKLHDAEIQRLTATVPTLSSMGIHKAA